MYSLVQNTTTYQIRIAHTMKGLWLCIEETLSNWKLTVTPELIDQTVAKVSGNNSNNNEKAETKMGYREFTDALLAGLKKNNPRWSIGVMTPI